MSIEAIAVVRIPYAELCAARDLTPAGGAAAARKETAPYVPVGEDGTAIFTGRSFSDDPEEVAAEVAGLLGGVETTGRVLLLPDKVWNDEGFVGYDALVEEAGELGEWVELPQAAPAMDLGAVAAMMGGMDPAAMAQQLQQAQQLMAQSPAAAKAAESMMKSMGGGDAMAAMMGNNPQMGGLLGMAQQMLSNMSDDQRASLEQLAQSMLSPGDDDDDES